MRDAIFESLISYSTPGIERSVVRRENPSKSINEKKVIACVWVCIGAQQDFKC